MAESKTDHAKAATPTPGAIDRRRALARLGLAAGVLYAAPMLAPLNQTAANAHSHKIGDGPPWGKPTKPGTTKPTKPGK